MAILFLYLCLLGLYTKCSRHRAALDHFHSWAAQLYIIVHTDVFITDLVSGSHTAFRGVGSLSSSTVKLIEWSEHVWAEWKDRQGTSQSSQKSYEQRSRWTRLTLGSNLKKIYHQKSTFHQSFVLLCGHPPHPRFPPAPFPELSFIFFEQAVHHPPPWQRVELRLPAGASFHCPCLSLCGLISPDELSQPQRGAQCLLSRDRYLYYVAVIGTRWTGTLPPSPPTYYLFPSFPTFSLPVSFLLVHYPENSCLSLGFC